MRSNAKFAAAACALLMLSSCGGSEGRAGGGLSGRPPASRAVSDFPVKLGEPYQVGGKSYVPADTLNYDEVGYASWYGEEMGGGDTANGEAFLPAGISAAHRTLPLPSYVEVTALDTGRTILVRVNDRGPFSSDRLIDLSKGAAEQLGIAGQGHAPVRVRRVNPPEQERAALRSGRPAAERLESPPALLNALRRRIGEKPVALAAAGAPPKPPVRQGIKPIPLPPSRAAVPPPVAGDRFSREEAIPPAPRPAPPPRATASGSWFVQLGAFGNRASAESLARSAGARAVTTGAITRVRFGPFANEAEAKEALRSAYAKGYREARVLRDAGG